MVVAMSGSVEISPMRLLNRVMWGTALIMGSAVPLVFVGHSGAGAHLGTQLRIRILGGAIALLVSGGAMLYSAERSFRRGMDAARWGDMELEPVRSWLEGRAPAAVFVLTLVFLVCLFWALRLNAMGWVPALIFPFGSVGRLRNMLQKPQEGIGTVEPRLLKALRSESWGR
jgi:hypothetical protein